MAGLIIVVVGSLLLLDNIGINIPSWIFTWSNILILIGLFIGLKHNFRNGSGIILIVIGSFFTLKNALDDIYGFDKFGWPVLIIGLGLFLIFKPKNNNGLGGWRGRRKDWKNQQEQNKTFTGGASVGSNLNSEQQHNTSELAYISSVNVFSGSHHVIYSKDFKGGEITAVFGGCDVNLTQADFEGQIVLDVTAIFGGAKIIIPAGWQIKNEVTAIFGGFDDKRINQPIELSNKFLIIKGTALFGGVDIRSY